MAVNSLADFFATGHDCRNWDLQKAVIRAMQGPHRQALERAAFAWQPTTVFHKTLKRIMVSPEHDHHLDRTWTLTHAQITPTVTRVRKELEALAHAHYAEPPAPPKPKPRPPKIDTLWDILNLGDPNRVGLGTAGVRYKPEEIKGAIACVLADDTCKRVLHKYARWHTPRNKYEQELTTLMLANERPMHLEPTTVTMRNQARRIIAYLRKSSFYGRDA